MKISPERQLLFRAIGSTVMKGPPWGHPGRWPLPVGEFGGGSSYGVSGWVFVEGSLRCDGCVVSCVDGLSRDREFKEKMRIGWIRIIRAHSLSTLIFVAGPRSWRRGAWAGPRVALFLMKLRP